MSSTVSNFRGYNDVQLIKFPRPPEKILTQCGVFSDSFPPIYMTSFLNAHVDLNSYNFLKFW